MDPQRWLTDPVECGRAAGFGIYVHIPFCAHRCGYCDFATWDDRGHLVDRYVAALGREIDAAEDPGRAVTSIFVGGGTPTMLEPDVLAGLVQRLHDRFDVGVDAEVTVECNPETARPGLFEALVDAGVDRISMGMQSSAPGVLATLERQHSPEALPVAVALARAAGIRRLNVDLIFGTPGETADDWAGSLAAALALGPDHLSAYALTVHDNTRMGRDVAAGQLPAPDEDVQRSRWEVARETLAALGWEHYEVSNWARTPGERSRHNLIYWQHGDYLAFGVGAHGHLDGHRWWNHRSIERYCDDVEESARGVANEERLADDERAVERLMLGLRLQQGLHPADAPPIDQLALEDALAADLVQTACGRLQCTERGWFLLDDAVTRLLPETA